MLRIYFLQHRFNLSDPAVEEALYDSRAMRRFVSIDLGREPVDFVRDTHPGAYLFPEGILPDWMSLGPFWNIFWGLLEALICVGLIIGLSVFFRERFSTPNRWMERFDQNVYGVYIIHVFIVVGLQQAILNIALPALVKFALVTTMALFVTFVNSALIRLIPGVKRVI